jgi:hypothetical protein
MSEKGFVDLEDLEEKEKVKEFAKRADLKKAERKGGRPRKEERAESFLNVYFTKKEKANVQRHCERMHISFSSFIKQLLAERGVI